MGLPNSVCWALSLSGRIKLNIEPKDFVFDNTAFLILDERLSITQREAFTQQADIDSSKVQKHSEKRFC